MSLVRGLFLVGMSLGLLMFSPASPAQSFIPVGGLDCNGFSKIPRPLRPQDICTTFASNTAAAMTTVITSGMTSRASASSRQFLTPVTMCSGNSRCRVNAACRLHSLSRTLSLSGSLWRSAIPVLFPMDHASRIVMKTLHSLLGLRSSRCSSIPQGIHPSSPKSVAI